MDGKPKIARGKVRELLETIGELQDLVGEAQGRYRDDISVDRATGLLAALDKAFKLCVDARNGYAPIDTPRRKKARDG